DGAAPARRRDGRRAGEGPVQVIAPPRFVRARSILVASLAALVAALPPGARASIDDTDPDVEIARRHFENGRDYYARKDYANALPAPSRSRPGPPPPRPPRRRAGRAPTPSRWWSAGWRWRRSPSAPGWCCR